MRLNTIALCVVTACTLIGHSIAAQTFQLLTEWPQANAPVNAIEVDAVNSVVYVGGDFTLFGGQSRSRLAALDLTTGALLPWAPTTDGTVNAIEVAGDSVIVTGGFSTMNGQPRANLACIDAVTGTLRDWAPVLSAAGFAVRAFEGSIYVGGQFTLVDGQTRNRAAAFSAADGNLTAWHPNAPASGLVRVIEPLGSHLLLGGLFNTIGGATRNNAVVVDTETGLATSWQANTNGVVIAAHVSGTEVLLGGQFFTVNGATRERIAAVSAADGSLLPWAPAFSTPGSGVRSIARVPEMILAGGNFEANGPAQTNLAAIGSVSGALLATTFTANTTVNSVVAHEGLILVGGGFSSVQPGGARQRFAAFSYCFETAWFADSDEDGFGDPASMLMACAAPPGHVSNDSDCDDSDPEIGEPSTWYQDMDGDSFGNPDISVIDCAPPDGYVSTGNDCDDTAPLINDATIWYLDGDEDGIGNADIWVEQCLPPPGYVASDTDCDDTDPLIGSGSIWYRDFDEDGFGVDEIWQYACDQPSGFVLLPGDCQDGEPTIYPGAPCDDGDPNTLNDAYAAFPACGCVGLGISVNVKLVLEGAYYTPISSMRDDLRVLGLIPTTEPYTALGYAAVGSPSPSGSVIAPAVLAASGPDAIVDWVVLELRDGANGAIRLHTRYVLVQRDGDVVDLDGVSPIRFPVVPGNYRLAALHRNHQGVVTAQGSALHGATIDFTSDAVEVHLGTGARATIDGHRALRMGDVSFNDNLMYIGDGNDRDPILVAVGGFIPTNVITGYRVEDTNMDGTVRYVGDGNDRDPILVGIGGSIPTAVRPNYYQHITP